MQYWITYIKKQIKSFYFKVCLVAAHATFTDGRNLHLIIENKEFWLEKLSKYWDVSDVISTEFHVWGLAIKK